MPGADTAGREGAVVCEGDPLISSCCLEPHSGTRYPACRIWSFRFPLNSETVYGLPCEPGGFLLLAAPKFWLTQEVSPQDHKWRSGSVKTRTTSPGCQASALPTMPQKWPSVRGGGSGISKGRWWERTCPWGHGAVVRPTCGRRTLMAATGGRFGKPESSCHHTLFCGLFMDCLYCSPQQTISLFKSSACHIFLKAKDYRSICLRHLE